MQQTTWIALILGAWSSLYLVDAFFKGHRIWSRHYLRVLEKTGCSVNICQLKWYTKRFNRWFVRLGQWRPAFLRLWFSCGAVFGLIAMLLSVLLLSLLVINTFRKQPVEQQVLTPVMPGVNLPVSHVSYYFVTLLVCGILHEIGHAVAAVREQVHVNGFGLFLLVLYPGAFVDLSPDHIHTVSPLRQLRVYCAGVWHNFVIVVLGALVLSALPVLLFPVYGMHKGVMVTSVQQNSAVSGPRGLAVGDTITSISGCIVDNLNDWHACIGHSMREKSFGHCMALDMIHHMDVINKLHTKDNNTKSFDGVDCCNTTSNTHLCFTYHVKKSPSMKYACLPARSVTDRPMCKFQSDCYLPKAEMVCVYPSIDNNTKLLQVVHGRRPPLLFLGHPLDLHYSVTLSNYVLRYPVLPTWFIFLPDVVELFCKYLISLSGALVILNVVPCYALDGQWICHAFIELSLRSTVPDRDTRASIYSIIVLFGTGLLFINVVIAMWTLFS